MKKIIAGFIAGAITFGGLGAYAATSININVLPLKYYFDGEQKKPTGNQLGFVYEGTTYVPLRFMAESLGKEVAWDGKTSSIYVGKKPDNVKEINAQFTYLSELTPYKMKKEEVFGERKTVKMKGVLYEPENTYTRSGDPNTFYLDKGYSKLTGIFGSDDFSRDYPTDFEIQLNIYADGKLVYGYEGKKSDEPVEVEVNLKGVNKLEIQVRAFGVQQYANFSDVKLYK